MIRTLLAACAAVAILLMAAPAAGAVTWTLQSVPPAQARNGQLFSDSCASSTACTGVGFFINSLGEQRPLAETWNGTSWVTRSVPMPAGVPFGHLHGVSCTSATSCIAVGATGFSDFPTQPLAERWNGTTWRIQTVPLPANTSEVQLAGVSCTSPSACTAVGAAFNFVVRHSVAVAARWNGTSWSAQTIPDPSGATAVQLNGVSCTGASACIAVGHYMTSAGGFFPDKVLAARWNGSNWTIQTTPLPSGTTDATFGGVSCSASAACTAVGGYSTTNSFPTKTLAERWNGSSWTIQTTPSPPSGNPMLSGVSCPAATSCTAVGAPIETSTPVVEKWNGTTWSLQAAAIPSGATIAQLSAVSCTAATACTAAGGFAAGFGVPQSALAERSDGTTWTTQTTTNGTGALPSDINGVSCSAASSCTAVGSFNHSSGQRRMLAEGWNGTSWTIQGVTGPSTSNGVLNAVSCTAPTACTAVGSYVNASSATVTLAERWNGTKWVMQSTPNPAGSTQVVFHGVSCDSVTSCTAVGSFFSSSAGHTVTLAEHWNGSSWTIKATPNPSGTTFGRLTGVSCTSPTSCTAVGGYSTAGAFSADKPLAEQWNGTSWTIKTTPSPTGATFATFTGVSCTAATACTAAGGFATTTGASFPSAPLAERWNGSTWAVQATTNPSSTGFGGASCPAATACTAVGQFFAEGWDGTTWTTQTLAFPSLGEAELFAVSCTAATACTAAGRVVENYFTAAIFVNSIFLGQMFTPLGERSS